MAVTPGVVILAVDTSNTGKNVDNVVVTNESAQTVYRQMVTLGDPITAANRQTVNSAGGAGVIPTPGPALQLTPFVINTASSGNIVLAAGSSGKTVRLYRLVLFVNGLTNITFEDAATPLSGPIQLNNGGNITLDFSGEPWYVSSSGNALNINSSNAVQVSGTAWYVQS